jgi:O-succinylbenzoic acid--CoA ligase
MVRVTSESVFRGYFPDASAGRTWETEDLGRLDPGGSLVILGRRDDVIVTGGKKVSASEVEAALRASGEFEDVVVVGVPDPQWGHCIVACHPGGGRVPSLERVRASLSPLAAYKHPKRFVPLSPWPRDSRGKVSRGALADLAARATG